MPRGSPGFDLYDSRREFLISAKRKGIHVERVPQPGSHENGTASIEADPVYGPPSRGNFRLLRVIKMKPTFRTFSNHCGISRADSTHASCLS